MNVAAALFGESASRVVVSVAPDEVTRVLERAAAAKRAGAASSVRPAATGCGWRSAAQIVDRSAGRRGRAGVVDGASSSTSPSVWPEKHARQIQGRVRRLRHLRPSRSRQHDLPRAVRAAAPRAGERRHRRVGRPAGAHLARDGLRRRHRSTARRCRSCPGPMAIGHVRYSTAGESKLLNAQPILIDCAHGQIALCHNGNLVNARELRDELVQQGSIFQSNSDTEVDPAPLRALEGARASRTRSSNRWRRCRARSRW